MSADKVPNLGLVETVDTEKVWGTSVCIIWSVAGVILERRRIVHSNTPVCRIAFLHSIPVLEGSSQACLALRKSASRTQMKAGSPAIAASLRSA